MKCTCTQEQKDKFSSDIHSNECPIQMDRQRRHYKELVGNKCRSNEIGPVVFPSCCPVCSAPVLDTTGSDRFPTIAYRCGGL